MKRVVQKDLELCNKVTPGPWRVSKEGYVVQTDHVTRDIWYIPHKDDDLNFVTESREALPYWINESLKARVLLIEISAHFQSDLLNEFDVKDWVKRTEEFLGGDEE